MSVAREPFSWVEIDVDGCSNTFGIGPCRAALGVGGCERKCHNTMATCYDPEMFAHDEKWRTLRYCQSRSNIPIGEMFFPALAGDISEVSATVNVAGSDSDLSAFGRRATITATLIDFPDHDRYMDPYQAGRVDGTAQIDEPGYDPYERGSHIQKLIARWPYFAGRPYRRCDGFIVDGEIVSVTTRHYIISEFTGPDARDQWKLSGNDVLDLADDKRTRAPKASKGVLASDIDVTQTVFSLAPEGIGDIEYPLSGRARIGSEIVNYKRSGDVITLTARAVNRTSAAAHKSGDTFQQTLSFSDAFIHDVVKDLLIEAGVDPAFIPISEWARESTRWLSSIRITRDVTEPTGVKTLISSLVPLGFSVFWESKDQQIALKANRPVDGDTLHVLSDENTNINISVKSVDKKRASDVLFWTVQKDPTSSPTSTDNYTRVWSSSDLNSRSPRHFRSGEIKSYPCPWLDGGSDGVVRVSAQRLLKRFNKTPRFITITLDAGLNDIRLTDVVNLETDKIRDVTGKPVSGLYQVISITEKVAGERIEIELQSFQFAGRFGYAVPNGTPPYHLATPAQRDPGMFACDPVTLKMLNGDPPYEAI